MKQLRLALLALSLTLFSTGCSLLASEDTEPNTFEKKHLYQQWVHSYEEEDTDSKEKIYRPKEFKEFPSSWFRMRYIFYRDGTCESLTLAPNDAHYFEDCTWSLNERRILELTEENADTTRFKIVHLTKDLLRMTFVESSSEK